MAGNADTTDNRLLTPRANTTRTAGTTRIGRVSLRERNGEPFGSFGFVGDAVAKGLEEDVCMYV